MVRRLNLNALETFAAAGRTGSFKGAAEVLFLSPSAVSQSIKRLESELGYALFVRKNQAVELTDQGELLFQTVSLAFDSIHERLDALAATPMSTVTVYSSPTFASQIVHPAMSDLMADGSLTDVRVIIADPPDLKLYRQFDIAVLYGDARHRPADVRPIGVDVFTPVCSPEIAASIRSAGDLAERPLIVSERHQVSWSDWFTANGVTPARSHAVRVAHAYQATQAALDGLGVSLESRRLAREELSSGRLVAPLFGSSVSIERPLHSIWVLPERGGRPQVSLLADAIERVAVSAIR
ncbi:LysR family transcriptional regulator [Streptomyces sioyaensis]|uniref:LysR family transcriptional regulator n=1 Tax=Streptomyces sioyaensis TaxID=67364 RepID=UPI0037D19A6E